MTKKQIKKYPKIRESMKTNKVFQDKLWLSYMTLKKLRDETEGEVEKRVFNKILKAMEEDLIHYEKK